MSRPTGDAPQRASAATARKILRVPAAPSFVSYAQNGEDVVLWRALQTLPTGRYVEVGANHPTSSSITRAFYDRGWTGIEIEPVGEFVEAFRRERPQDTVVQVAVTDEDVDSVTLHVVDGTGLSTLDDDIGARHQVEGWATRDEVVPARRLDAVLDEHLAPGDDIHFMVVDTEGSERNVLASVDLRRWRPWVLVVEATAPNSPQPTHGAWEHLVLEAGYEFCLFDGLSRFYVAEEHVTALRPALSAPANPLDGYVLHEVQRQAEELADLRSRHHQVLQDLIRWRGTVLTRWAEASSGGGGGGGGHEVVRLRKELADTHATISWRITAPLRAAQERRLRGRR
jgi:FkbM family methyltransferase